MSRGSGSFSSLSCRNERTRRRTTGSSASICFSTASVSTIFQGILPHKSFQRNQPFLPRLHSLQCSHRDEIVLAIFDVLLYRLPCVVALGAPCLLRQGLQPVLQLLFQSHSEHCHLHV